MALTNYTKHNNCNVKARLLHTGKHYAELRCIDCKERVQYLTWWDYVEILKWDKN